MAGFHWKSFLKSVAVIAIPVALQNLLTTTGSMVDTVMIAPLGENTVAAVGLCAQFSSLMFSCYWGFVCGGMLFFSQYWGARDHDGIDRSYGTTLCFLMAVAVAFLALGRLAPDFIMRVYTDKSAIRQIGITYLRTVCFSYPFQIFSMGMSAVLRSTERVRIPLYASVASVLINMGLNWVFIYGHFGLPAMGVRGAALATVCASAVNALTILLFALVTKYPYLFHFRRHFCWQKGWVSAYLRKCFPIICNELLIGIGMMIINVVLGRQPEEAIAALAVFRTLEGLVIGFFSGFSNASSVLVGKSVGAGELPIAYERAKRLIYLCGSVIAVVCVGLLIFHTPILHAMSLQGDAFYYGTGMLAIYCVAAVIRMCNWTQNDTFRAAGDTFFGTILEISFMYAMVLPAILLAGFAFKWPTLLVFACAYIDEPVRFCIMQGHMYSGKWIKPVTSQGMEALSAFQSAIKKKKYFNKTEE